jgi:hypothetical protein
LKNNALIITFVLVGLFLLTPMLSTASAAQTSYKANATGVGVFVHDHDGIPHTHYFVFSISSNSKTAPQGQFSLVCTHDGQIDTIIFSTKISSLSVEPVQGGLKAVFTGSALVKMGDANWEKGWTFTVTAYDLGGRGSDLIGITLFTPQGQVQCSADPTPLNSGNIAIRASF